MEILMYGLACDDLQFDKYIKKHNAPYSVAHYLFETSLLRELKDFSNVNIKHNYILQEKFEGMNNIYIKKIKREINDSVTTTYVSYVNLPGIKFITIFISTFIRTFKWALKNRKTNCFIISTINYFPVAFANYLVSKLLKVCNIIILTDCSNGYAYQSAHSGIKSKIKKIYTNFVKFLEQNYSAYIFFSEGMNEYINKNKHPWMVMEGMYSIKNEEVQKKQVKKENAIMYAGTLQPHLGIEVFVEAFKRLSNADYQLWIFGDGDYRNHIQNQLEIDDRIKFFGFVDQAEILKREKQARLLINTRNPSDAYTWMSFPSKTFEYMASGTPFLTTKIKSIPESYEQYLYTVEYDIEKISKKMEEILSKKQSKLDEFGYKASEYIRTNKNPYKQSKRIYEFLKELEKR